MAASILSKVPLNENCESGFNKNPGSTPIVVLLQRMEQSGKASIRIGEDSRIGSGATVGVIRNYNSEIQSHSMVTSVTLSSPLCK